jgi:L-Ala-D/L-Glu epimerase
MEGTMMCMLGCMRETRLGLTAAAHVVCSQPNIIYADLDSFTTHKTDPILGGMEVRGGTVSLPEKPGLGVNIDPAWLKTLKKA